jgi:hypothetical protein
VALEYKTMLPITDRKYIPSSNGIYKHNSLTGKYGYLIPMSYAEDCYTGDAITCDKNGKHKKGMEYPVPVCASNFGVKIAEIEKY